MKKSPKPVDMNQRMFAVVQEAAGLTESPQVTQKDPQAVKRGRLGGKAAAAKLTPQERKVRATNARAVRTARAARRNPA